MLEVVREEVFINICLMDDLYGPPTVMDPLIFLILSTDFQQQQKKIIIQKNI